MPVPHLRFIPSPTSSGVEVVSGQAELQPEPGRYRLVGYVGCPWCRRAVIARRLLGLDSVIALSQAWQAGQDGFIFRGAEADAPAGDDACGFDPDLRIHTHRELYRRQPCWEPGEPTSVPVLVDDKDPHVRGAIVMRESADIVYDFATAWQDYHAEDAPQLYPVDDPAVHEAIENFTNWMKEDLIAYFGRLIHSAADDEEERTYCQRRIVEALVNLNEFMTDRELTVDGQVRVTDIGLFSTLVSFASWHASNAFKAGKESAVRQGADPEGAIAAGKDAVERAGSPFADWPHVDAFYQRLSDNPKWITAAEKDALHLP